MDINTQIIKLRADRNLTIEEFAERLKADDYPISYRTVEGWFSLSRPSKPTPKHTERIETVFGITFEVIIKPNPL